jgi:hypothetical protein
VKGYVRKVTWKFVRHPSCYTEGDCSRLELLPTLKSWKALDKIRSIALVTRDLSAIDNTAALFRHFSRLELILAIVGTENVHISPFEGRCGPKQRKPYEIVEGYDLEKWTPQRSSGVGLDHTTKLQESLARGPQRMVPHVIFAKQRKPAYEAGPYLVGSSGYGDISYARDGSECAGSPPVFGLRLIHLTSPKDVTSYDKSWVVLISYVM